MIIFLNYLFKTFLNALEHHDLKFEIEKDVNCNNI
jgi:hypothetical protein